MYAAVPSSREHERARTWLSERFADPDSFVGLCWPVLFSFVRVVSNPRIIGDAAVGPAEAWRAADAFRRQTTARLVEPGDAYHRIADELFHTPGLRPNDVPDVQIAALAMDGGLALCTHDHGFARFSGLRWSDPLR